MEIDVRNLHPLEIRLLRHVSPGEPVTAQRLIDELDYKIGQCNQAFSWLTAKGFLEETERKNRTLFELTELGRQQLETGTPAQRIFRLLKETGPASLPEIAERLALDKSDVGSAFGLLSKSGTCRMGDGNKAHAVADEAPREVLIAAEVLAKAAAEAVDEATLSEDELAFVSKNSKKRGAAGSPLKLIEREEVFYRLTKDGEDAKSALLAANITGEEFGAVTTSMLSTGSWKQGSFRPYSLNTPPARLIPGRRNPYASYLQWVKDKLCSLGFEEFDGPLVENEFWNGDALFMPQFHSARDIHDVYYVKNPSHAKRIEEPYLSQVAMTHENGWETGSRGWQYGFDHEFTRRQVMRSQGTVLSAKTLPQAKVPGKYFGVVRCFRYDQVDATHGADFYQTEGIVLGNDVNLRTLLGLLKMFAEEVAGAEEVKYVPGYFPFTEPSIEVHIKHPVLGWFELGGSGIFRPEVTKALGVDVPVLAWGLGIDRMALMHLGLNDLRELFTPDIESVRMRRGN
ncbi:MAG: phenylalanine--tRNA ligase subunit alpha [Sphaerochaetaceae bacterium]|jgi:phenylalanyl-tRNA synthetase alpha chain|nr:phenylalanine--tRNA ligase subunit alpha [Sphaerochaetaceae bacterium]